jgi:D-alanine-D-alanine ligase
MRTFDFDALVLVADLRDDGLSSRTNLVNRRDLEQTEHKTFDEIVDAVESLGLPIHHYKSPADLARHADKHGRDLILSIYGGVSSRNRMAITPAVCEAFGLRYIGPDTYGRIVAQDKEISKRLAMDCGLLTPAWRVIRTEREASFISHQSAPLVVKPLLEGSSIGISETSLTHSSKEAAELAKILLRDYGQPVLVEQFVAGREVSYTKIENPNADIWGMSEVVIADEPDYFVNRLFHAEEKTIRDPRRTVHSIDRELSVQDKTAIDKFLRAFGHYGYCRVDGRLSNRRFYFIELTPDAWLGSSGQFAMSYTKKGWSYKNVIAAILSSATITPQVQQSND